MIRKIFIVLLLLVTCMVFAGDLVKLIKWDEPIIWQDLKFSILGTGMKKFVGTQTIMEAAINNTGEIIDILELTVTWIDDDTGFPLNKVEFMELDVPAGIGIMESMPFDIMELTGNWIGIENVIQQWTGKVQRF